MEPQETTQPENNKKQSINLAGAIITSAAMIAIALIIIVHPAKSAGTPTSPTPSNAPAAAPTSVAANIVTVRPADMTHVRGDLTTAQVLIFEYSDSDCPFCVRFHPTLQQVVSDYKGKVAWIYRYFPLTIHPNAFNEALALQCVGQIGGAKAFNAYLDTVINVTLNPDPQSNKMLATFATQQGIDGTKFTACFNDTATATTVNNDLNEAQSIGAQGTPYSILVNVKTGKQIIIPGAYPIADIKKDIDSLLQ